MQTFSKRLLDIGAPTVDDVYIEDIAHALSQICRYTGHTPEFYSVAQHAVIASGFCDEYPFEALMHDAAEAYTGDVSRPLKGLVPEIRKPEEVWHKVIAQRFSFRYPYPSEVHMVDQMMLTTEHTDVMGHAEVPGSGGSSVWWREFDDLPRLRTVIIPLPPKEAERLFLERFNELRDDRRGGIVTGIRDAGERFDFSRTGITSPEAWWKSVNSR